VSKLEHDFFGRNQNPSLPKAHQKKEKKDIANNDTRNSQDRLRLNFNIVDDEETWYAIYFYLVESQLPFVTLNCQKLLFIRKILFLFLSKRMIFDPYSDLA